MKNLKKKSLLLFLAASLALTLPLPGGVVHAGSNANNYIFDISEGHVSIQAGSNAGYLKVKYGGGTTTPDFPESQEITIIGSSTTNSNGIWVEAGSSRTVNLVLSDVTVDPSGGGGCAMALLSSSTLNLTLKGTNTLTSGSGSAGIEVTSGNTLTITADSTGSLTAIGGSEGGAGIGGGNSGNIVINGGTVTASGNFYAAGIGGGRDGSGTVTINGGTVTAYGASQYGAGIGGGGNSANSSNIKGGTVTINGGTVTAYGGHFGAGIGGGMCGAGTVTITGGTVTASGGMEAAGIGGGGRGNVKSTISISGGNVTAYGSYADGIGNGYQYGSNEVVIRGGSVNSSITTAYYDSALTTRAYLTTVTLEGVTAVTDVSCTVDTGSAISVSTDSSGKLYLWLPSTSSTTQILVTAETPANTFYLASGSAGSALTAFKLLKITGHPADAEVCMGETVTLSVAAAASLGTLSYQWYSNTTNISSGGSIISNATGSSFTVPTSQAGTVYYYCIVTSKYFSLEVSDASNCAAVTVDVMGINTQPSDVAVAQGGTATLAIAASGAGTLSYQWYSNSSDSNSGGSIITNATGSSFTVPTSAVGTRYYYCIVSMEYNSNTYVIASDAAAVLVVGAIISSQPADDSILRNGTATLAVAASGAGTLSYQWYSNSTDSNSGGTPISGETDRIYLAPTASVGTNYYYCVITDTYNSIKVKTASRAAEIAVILDTHLVISTTSLPIGIIGEAYSAALSVTGGDGTTQTWSTDSDLPSGLSLSTGGAITGTPTETGVYSLSIEVADDSHSDTVTLSLTICDTAASGLSGLSVTDAILSPEFNRNISAYIVEASSGAFGDSIEDHGGNRANRRRLNHRRRGCGKRRAEDSQAFGRGKPHPRHSYLV